MDNLQTEVLELEFYEFSKGNIAITEVDFAKILLRYTYLVSFVIKNMIVWIWTKVMNNLIISQDTDEYDMYLDRLLDRVKHEKGVSFKEFKDFCQFLNNLEDFSIAMRMYTLSDQAISKGSTCCHNFSYFSPKFVLSCIFSVQLQANLRERWKYVPD